MFIIDFETTGHAFSFYSFPCEVGIIKIENNKIIDYYSSLIKPPEFYKNTYIDGLRKAFSIHQISYEEILKEGKDIKEVAGEVKEFILKYNSKLKNSIYAWNYKFDKTFLIKLFVFAEEKETFSFVESLDWKEISPAKFKGTPKGLSSYVNKELYNLIHNEILPQNEEVRKIFLNSHRHRALYDTILEFAVYLKNQHLYSSTQKLF